MQGKQRLKAVKNYLEMAIFDLSRTANATNIFLSSNKIGESGTGDFTLLVELLEDFFICIKTLD